MATDDSAGMAAAGVAETEARMATLIGDAGFPGNLAEAVSYAALQGGKRTRPRLVHLSAAACGGGGDAAGWLAASIEFVHAFSLVHDDLPCLDDDLLRRGVPTTHAKFGEAMGLLAGDALLNLAYAALLRGGLSAPMRVRAFELVSSSTNAMIGGQVLDTLGGGGVREGEDPTSRLIAIHSGKTAALIEASCRLGGVACGVEAGSTQDGALRAYGAAVGLMFQIVDDVIDATQEASHAGKATGKDVAAGKLTYPAVHGLEGSMSEVARLLDEARDAAASLGAGAGLAGFAEALAARTR